MLSFGAESLSFSLPTKNLKITICITIIVPVVLRKERRLRVFENRVLRIFGPKRDEVTRKWRKLHNEKLYYLYILPNMVRVIKSRRMRWAGHVVRIREKRGVQRVLVGKPEAKRPLGRPGVGWRTLVNAVMNLRVP